jgi:uncharacterized protein YndB with AHSA1/START domain
LNDATLSTSGPRPTLRLERDLPASIDAVWRAVTDPDEMRSWFPTRIEIDEWKVGGHLTHHFDGHDLDPLPGTVIEWQPPHRVRFTWGEDTITFELTAAPVHGTTFVLTAESSPPRVARDAAGWESCLDQLQFGRETESWTIRFDHYVANFQPVFGHQDGPPENFDVS